MTNSEQFAIDEWLFEYPKDASFDDILYMLLDSENESIVPFGHGENMSRQDRSDAMWLAENWIEIQSKTKELDVSSCSASYLRQLLRKADKQATDVKATTQESTEGTDAVDNEDSTEGKSSAESPTVKLSGNDAESIAVAVIQLAKLKGISLAEIATLLLASAE
jgi:hypothetical protein